MEIKQQFSEKDIKLVRLVSKGFTAKEIADKLNLPKRTVEDRKRRLMDKCGCKSFVEVALMFLRERLID